MLLVKCLDLSGSSDLILFIYVWPVKNSNSGLDKLDDCCPMWVCFDCVDCISVVACYVSVFSSWNGFLVFV